MIQKMLNAFRLSTHNKRYSEQRVGRQLAKNKHQSVMQHFTTVVYLLIYITNRCNTREECAGVENHQETQEQG